MTWPDVRFVVTNRGDGQPLSVDLTFTVNESYPGGGYYSGSGGAFLLMWSNTWGDASWRATWNPTSSVWEYKTADSVFADPTHGTGTTYTLISGSGTLLAYTYEL